LPKLHEITRTQVTKNPKQTNAMAAKKSFQFILSLIYINQS
jgi:hypothetical protein